MEIESDVQLEILYQGHEDPRVHIVPAEVYRQFSTAYELWQSSDKTVGGFAFHKGKQEIHVRFDHIVETSAIMLGSKEDDTENWQELMASMPVPPPSLGTPPARW